MSKKRVILGTIAFLVAVPAVMWALRGSAFRHAEHPISEKIDARAPSTSPGETVAPFGVEALKKWPESRQLDLIDTMQRDSALPEASIAMLLGILQSSQFSQLVRNQAGTALVTQTQEPPQMREVLIGMVQNQAEDPVLRDYAVQFLGVLAERPTTPSGALVLVDLVIQGEPDLAGTAAVQLRRLHDSGMIHADIHIDAAVVDLVNRAAGHPIGQMGALAAMQGRTDAGALAAIRGCLSDDNPHVRRLAVVALQGQVTPADHPTLEAMANSADPLIAAAAQRTLAFKSDKK